MSKQKGWFDFKVKGRKTTCVYRHPDYYKTFVGRAKCDPKDEFLTDKGRQMSKLRALAKFNKWELKELDRWHEIHFNAAKVYKDAIFAKQDEILELERQINVLTGKKDEDEI